MNGRTSQTYLLTLLLVKLRENRKQKLTTRAASTSVFLIVVLQFVNK